MIANAERWILLAQIFSTISMVGLIWFVQIVHYPLMGQVGEENFRKYEMDHQLRTAWVVGPLMVCEMATALMLLWVRPSGAEPWSVWFGFSLLAVIWIGTYTIQVPYHAKLTEKFDAVIHRRLVNTNWIRTIAWTTRGLVVLSMT